MQVTGDRWQVTGDTQHITHDTWRMTQDQWHVTCGTWHVTPNWWHMKQDNFSFLFSFLSVLVSVLLSVKMYACFFSLVYISFHILLDNHPAGSNKNFGLLTLHWIFYILTYTCYVDTIWKWLKGAISSILNHWQNLSRILKMYNI